MSFDILHQPTSPNVTDTELVYTMSSSNAGQPQFRYVMYFGLSDTTLKVYPNLDGIGTFNISGPVSSYFNPTSYPQFGSGGGISSVADFSISYGEEYAATLNDTPTYYYIGNTPSLEVLPGYKNINDNTGTGYNFDSGSYAILDGYPELKSILSDNPYTFKIGETEQIKRYIPRTDGWASISTLVQGGVGLDATAIGYDSSGNQISFDSYTFGQSTPYDQFTVPRIAVIPFSYTFTNLYNVFSSVAYYDIIMGGTDQISRFHVLDECDYEDKTTFVWQNKFGQWESYFVSNPVKRSSNINRYDYDRTFVRYEDNNSSYNINNRGKRQYRTQYDYTYQVTTDFITKEEANWLSELIESKNVFVYGPNPNTKGDIQWYAPIQITNSSYEVNNSTSRNKLFQYTLEYKPSLQLQER